MTEGRKAWFHAKLPAKAGKRNDQIMRIREGGGALKYYSHYSYIGAGEKASHFDRPEGRPAFPV